MTDVNEDHHRSELSRVSRCHDGGSHATSSTTATSCVSESLSSPSLGILHERPSVVDQQDLKKRV